MKKAKAFVSWMIIASMGCTVGVYGETLKEMAKPLDSVIYVDGTEIGISSYNIGGFNFYKLRDLAYILRDTPKEFSVSWDEKTNKVTLKSGEKYTTTGGELTLNGKYGDETATRTDSSIIANDKPLNVDVYNLTDSNYFKLRDIMKIFNVGVSFDESSKAIYIDTNSVYIDEYKKDVIPMNAEDIYSKCSNAVFAIKAYDKNKNLLGTGSGFFVDSKGSAYTNYHVIDGAYYIKAVLTDGRELDGEYVLGYDVNSDVAAIKIKNDAKAFSYLNTQRTSPVNGGEKIFTMGSPMGLQNTISEGIVSNPSRVFETEKLIQITAPISQGSSGGALIDAKGNAVGITSEILSEGQNLNFAVPISVANGIEKRNKLGFGDVAEAEKDRFDRVYMVFEKEPNNDYSNADYFSEFETVSGTITPKDVDYFNIVIDKAGTLDVVCITSDEDTKNMTLKIYDKSDGSFVTGALAEPVDGVLCVEAVKEITKAGTYSIVVSAPNVTASDIGYNLLYYFGDKN